MAGQCLTILSERAKTIAGRLERMREKSPCEWSEMIAPYMRPPVPGAIYVHVAGDLPMWLHPETYNGVSDPIGPPEDYLRYLHRMADEKGGYAMCYFIGGETGFIKIGFTIDLRARLCALQGSSPIPLSLLAARDGGQLRESAYHYQFADHRKHGEWFARVPEIEAEIARLSTPLATSPDGEVM